MRTDSDELPHSDYLKTWHWECPDHGRVEMFMTNPPMCARCEKNCIQVANRQKDT